MKRTVSLICAAALCLVFSLGFAAGDEAELFRNGVYTYRLDGDGNAEIVEIAADYRGVLMIADELDGHPVTAIGDAALMDRDGLTGVMIPAGVIKVGDYAFCGCDALKTVVLPSGLRSVGVSAFMFCRKLSFAALGDGLDEIGAHAFCGCDALEAVTIPSSVSAIGDHCFLDCAPGLKVYVTPGSYAAGWCDLNGIDFVCE